MNVKDEVEKLISILIKKIEEREGELHPGEFASLSGLIQSYICLCDMERNHSPLG